MTDLEALEKLAVACDDGARCFRSANEKASDPHASAEQQEAWAALARQAKAEIKELRDEVANLKAIG